MYGRFDLMVKWYLVQHKFTHQIPLDGVLISQLLATKAPLPLAILHVWEPDTGCHNNLTSIPTFRLFERPARSSENMFDLLLRLDSRMQPSISLVEFSKLWRKCCQCRLIMTGRICHFHNCAKRVQPVVIYLTSDMDDDALTSLPTTVNLTQDPVVINLTLDSNDSQ